jgi:hypothetical protein
MSLVKFSNRHIHNGKRLHWARAEEDGLPFRGSFAPVYTQEEFENRVVKVGDPHAETFDLSNQEQKALYLSVLDGIVNGWFQLLHIDRWKTDTNVYGFVWVEWVEFFLEDGHATPYMSQNLMETTHGPASIGLPLFPEPQK